MGQSFKKTSWNNQRSVNPRGESKKKGGFKEPERIEKGRNVRSSRKSGRWFQKIEKKN